MNTDWLERVRQSVVPITGSKPANRAFGTGFVFDQDGQHSYIVTCNHVIAAIKAGEMDGAGNGQAIIRAGGIPARIMIEGWQNIDLAILLIENTDLPVLSLRKAGSAGRAFGIPGYNIQADNSWLERVEGTLAYRSNAGVPQQPGQIDYWNLNITSNSPLSLGYSGSPLIDIATCSVIGVVSHKADGGKQGRAFVIENLERVWPPAGRLIERENSGQKDLDANLFGGQQAGSLFTSFQRSEQEIPTAPIAPSSAPAPQMQARDVPRLLPSEPRRRTFEDLQSRPALDEDVSENARTSLQPEELPRFFFGREAELDDGKAHMLAGRFPLLVYGLGGIGKTAFLARLFNDLREEAPARYNLENIIWIRMRDDGISSLSEIVQRIAEGLRFASVLNLDEQEMRQPTKRKEILNQKLARLKAELSTLPEHVIVFDNVDTEAHGEAICDFQEKVSERIVVGSRQAIGLIAPEIVHLLAPAEQAAVDIFQRYANRDPGSDRELVHSICQLLGYHTLAIRIIALPKSGAYKSQESLNRLQQRLKQGGWRLDLTSPKSEERNMRLSFSISYDDLDEHGKLIFDVCGALASSGAPLEAIMDLSGLSEDRCQALLDSQPVSALIEEDPQRAGFYKMHQLLHDFAREKLRKREGDLALDFQRTPTARMINHYVRYARRYEQNHSELEKERDNLLLAAEQAWRHRQWEAVHTFWDKLSTWLDATGDWEIENRLSLRALHANSPRCLPNREVELAKVLNSRSSFHEERGHKEIAQKLALKSLVLGRQVNDDRTIVSAMVTLSLLYQDHFKRLEEGHALLQEAWKIVKRIPAWEEAAYVAYQLGQSYWWREEIDAAIEWMRKCCEIARERRSLRYEGYALTSLGNLYQQQGDLKEARVYLEQSLKVKEKVKNTYSIAIALASLADLAEYEGNMTEAIAKLEEAVKEYHRTGKTSAEIRGLRDLGDMYQRAKQYKEALKKYEATLALSEEKKLPAEQAFTQLRLAQHYEELGDYGEALNRYGKRYKLLAEMPDPPTRAISLTLMNMGEVHETLQNTWQARLCYAKAREWLGDRIDSLELMDVIGDLKRIDAKFHLENFAPLLEQARDLLEKEVGQAAAQKDGSRFLSLGNNYLALGELELARATFDRVRDLLDAREPEESAP